MSFRFLALLAALPLALGAQQPARLSFAVGPFEIDDLAGTPNVVSMGVHKPFGLTGLVGGRLSWIRDAGFYGLDAAALDLDLGVRSRPARFEGMVMGGPWAMLGGDGDGTPYTHVGLQGASGATVWLHRRVGLMALATARVTFVESDNRVGSGASFGLVVRR
ncbi:MAG: hypothetical protein JNL26_02290 [Gemmatimonadetes bacterium]|nr:hypothetical protein [Gemmatimonadota bacterium]